MYHSISPVIIIIISLTFSVLISGILINAGLTYAQRASPNTPKVPLLSSSLTSSQPPVIPKLHSIRITSPAKGQQVPIGKDLSVSGISSTIGVGNATTKTTSPSTCQAYVIVNSVKPYQPVNGTGPGGAAD